MANDPRPRKDAAAEREADLRRHREVFDRVSDLAMDPDDTVRFLGRIGNEL